MFAQQTRFPMVLYPTPIANPWEAWRLGWMVSEFWLNAACKAFGPSGWLAGTDPTSAPLREWQRLWSEQMSDHIDVAMEMQRAGSNLLLGCQDSAESRNR
jgi:hypothetical protein